MKTKKEVNYRIADSLKKRCGNCGMFAEFKCKNPDGSTHTEGTILPFMVCKDWVPEDAENQST